MLFPTLAFHVFFLTVFLLNWLMRRCGEWRHIMLLLASWFFYSMWDGRFVLLLIVSAMLNWGVGRLIVTLPARGRLWLVTGVVANLIILGFFKYYNFFTDELKTALTGLGLMGAGSDIGTLDIILPVGISFFTFQGISYIVDVWRKKSEPARLLELTLLMSFFPHLVAGPIVRPGHILPQLREPPRLDRGTAAISFLLILWGVIKKAVIANELAVHLVDPVFNDPQSHAAADLIFAAYGYAIQIYCDFSAYTDIAIGLAGLLGFRFPRNFAQPYRAVSLQDFWRRWHISLSSWLRDYLYIGVFGGSRQTLWRTCLALFMTMVLGGLWHGASLNFVIWGALHGGVLVAERLWKAMRPATFPTMPGWVGWLLTFHLVTLAWVFFRCRQFGDALAYLQRIIHGEQGVFIASPWMALMIILGMACQFGPANMMQRLGRAVGALSVWAAGLIGALALLIVEGLRGQGIAPFIYFQF